MRTIGKGNEPIGGEALTAILDDAATAFAPKTMSWGDFLCPSGVYRLNDGGDYVFESAWDGHWAAKPAWHEKAWMLSDNGAYAFDEVAAMTVAEIEAAYDDPGFEPENAFYTEIDECDVELNIAELASCGSDRARSAA